MKGNKTVIDALNKRLSEECTAVSQYMIHSQMCENWGYEDLGNYIKGRAIEEMKHAERLIERILFLEGVPVIKLGTVYIGEDVKEMMDCDHKAEEGAIKNYNETVSICVKEADNGTRKMVEEILADEERHIDKIEENLAQISQMKIENYLTEQI